MTDANEKSKQFLNIHAILPRTRVHGPGERFVVLTQGCGRGCPGCINEDARPRETRMLRDVNELFEEIRGTDGVEGISLSGGEPLEQIDACVELCRLIKDNTDLSVVAFTGYYLDEIRAMPRGGQFLDTVDLLVAGPFIKEQLAKTGIAGSTNQEVVFLTPRYSLEDIGDHDKFEIYIQPDGKVIMTGILPKSLKPGEN